MVLPLLFKSLSQFVVIIIIITCGISGSAEHYQGSPSFVRTWSPGLSTSASASVDEMKRSKVTASATVSNSNHLQVNQSVGTIHLVSESINQSID